MILESVRSFYNGFYKTLVDNLPEVQNGFALPMNGIGLGVDLNSSLLDSQDTSKKITTSKDI